VAVLQVAVFEDHLDDAAARVGYLRHRPDIVANIVPVLAENFSDIDDHVQLGAAVLQRRFGFGYLHGCPVAAVRKPEDCAGGYGATGQQFGASLEEVRFDAGGRHIILTGQAAPVFQLRVRQARVEQGMVDHLCDIEIGIVHG